MTKSKNQPQIFAEQVAETRKLTASEMKRATGARRSDPSSTYKNVATDTGWWLNSDSDLDGQVDKAY